MILFCAFIYLIFFIIFIIFSYKFYLVALSELSSMHSFNMNNDIAKLIYDFPILSNQCQHIPLNKIKLIYDIHGIHNYSEFIYPANGNVEILHSILNYEPEVASRFSSMIVQDIIDTHFREIAKLTEQFIKRIFKCSIPLGGMILLFGVVSTMALEFPGGILA
jgi:hypothetical protein